MFSQDVLSMASRRGRVTTIINVEDNDVSSDLYAQKHALCFILLPS